MTVPQGYSKPIANRNGQDRSLQYRKNVLFNNVVSDALVAQNPYIIAYFIRPYDCNKTQLIYVVTVRDTDFSIFTELSARKWVQRHAAAPTIVSKRN